MSHRDSVSEYNYSRELYEVRTIAKPKVSIQQSINKKPIPPSKSQVIKPVLKIILLPFHFIFYFPYKGFSFLYRSTTAMGGRLEKGVKEMGKAMPSLKQIGYWFTNLKIWKVTGHVINKLMIPCRFFYAKSLKWLKQIRQKFVIVQTYLVKPTSRFFSYIGESLRHSWRRVCNLLLEVHSEIRRNFPK